MDIKLVPEQVFKKILYLILFLLCANILGIISKIYFDNAGIYGLVKLFDFDTERNIPTLYSSVALIFVAILLSCIAFTFKKLNSPYMHWLGLSLIFLFLSIDESSQIHERLIRPVRETFDTSGLLFFAWVIPYSAALIIFIIAYSKFLFELPKNIMALFLISGATFVLGAIGFELLGGRQFELFGKMNILYCFYYTCEESLEMLGVALFIYTLLTYIASHLEGLTIIVPKKQST